MKLLKLASALVAIALLACPFAGCDEEDNSTGANGGANGAYDPNSPSDSVQPSVGGEVYEKYKNLVRIEEFVNDRAAFVVFEDGTTDGNTFYGYMDSKGNVIVEPQYPLGEAYGYKRYEAAPVFEYNYVKVKGNNNVEYIIDLSGNVQFEVGKKQVSAIGNVSNGYFWVETEEEKVSGNEYTVKYYSATDMKVVATFENIRAVPDNMTIDVYNSTFDKSGKALLAYDLDRFSWGEKDLKRIDVTDFDSSFKPEFVELPFELNKVSDYKNTNSYYYLSSADNSAGQIAAVRLRNEQGVYFYSTIDINQNVLMKPQKNVAFPAVEGVDYKYCKNLCPAVDSETGLWGYVDPYGKWVISAQYQNASSFSKDGFAIVNSAIVINTKGTVVLSPSGWQNDAFSTLDGTYTYNGGNDRASYTLILRNDGTFELMTHMQNGKGTYKINGGVLTTFDLGLTWCHVLDNDAVYTYSFIAHTGNLFIDGYLWEKAK